MYVLTIFKGAIQASNQGHILGMILEWLHRGSEFHRINARFVLFSLLVLGLVRIKTTYKPRQHSLFFAREKTAPHNPVGDVHDHQLLVGFLALLSRSRGLRHRV